VSFNGCIVRLNLREIGIYTATEVLKAHFEQFYKGPATTAVVNQAPFDLPVFKRPKMAEINLPGGLLFFRSTLPESFPIPRGILSALTTRQVDPENVTVIKVRVVTRSLCF
jgi:hypothetical protein